MRTNTQEAILSGGSQFAQLLGPEDQSRIGAATEPTN